MIFPFLVAAFQAVSWVFTSGSIWAQGIRFVAGTIISQLLAGEQKSEGPRLTDLKIQVSSYGNAIPRIYGEQVRIAGNVIDKSDLIETQHKKKKKMLGFTVASQTWYTYHADIAILLCEGELPAAYVRKIRANGKVLFDRDAATTPPTVVGGGTVYTRDNETHSVFSTMTVYPGSLTQDIDPTLQELHDTDPVPAYRGSAYVVITGLQLADWGNAIPNLEFEMDTAYPMLDDTVRNLATFADVDLHALSIRQPLRSYVVAQAGSVWSAIEPLAGVFAFDLVAQGASFRTVRRGRYMRVVLDVTDFAARPPGGRPIDVAEYNRTDANAYADEVTVTYLDVDRQLQPSTQRAFRNAGYSRNKIDFQVAVGLNADEARQVAGRKLAESLASTRSVKIYASDKKRDIEAADVIGIPIAGVVWPFRVSMVNRSPLGVITIEGVFDDPLSYSNEISGASGGEGDNPLRLPGDTVLQFIDASILNDEGDTGFYVAVNGTGTGWRGCEIFRAEGIGSPLTFELVGNPGIPAIMGTCSDTLADGPTDVWDYVNTLDVQLLGDDILEAVTEEDVLVRNANFAWVGAEDGQGGEYINFQTATPSGSPNVWTLSNLLRGRRGTEFAVAGHGAGERFVLMEDDPIGRMDYGPADWNVARTYKAISIHQDDGDTQEFTSTGEGKRPYSGVHLVGTRNGSNNDIAIGWTRRTRLRTAPLGPATLGEDAEAYEIDIYAGLTVVRTLTSTTPAVNYTEAMQTADGHTLGAAVTVDVFQMSGVRGRGHVLNGTV